jgi:hypothetical protein
MAIIREERHLEKKPESGWRERFSNRFVWWAAFWQIVFGILFAIFMTYDREADGHQVSMVSIGPKI